MTDNPIFYKSRGGRPLIYSSQEIARVAFELHLTGYDTSPDNVEDDALFWSEHFRKEVRYLEYEEVFLVLEKSDDRHLWKILSESGKLGWIVCRYWTDISRAYP